MISPKIAVIDYGMGNLRSVAKALERVGANVVVTGRPKEIVSAEAVVFPGVGSFAPAARFLKQSGLTESIEEVIDSGKCFLGLCLGFQLLFDASVEGGRRRGLGIIPGEVVRFEFGRGGKYKVPHMGWNQVHFSDAAKITMFKGIPDGSYFYFVHSYYGKPEERLAISGTTEYGKQFCSAIAWGRTWACQFHPEKSGINGLRLLRNFVTEVKKCS